MTLDRRAATPRLTSPQMREENQSPLARITRAVERTDTALSRGSAAHRQPRSPTRRHLRPRVGSGWAETGIYRRRTGKWGCDLSWS